ncbi:hypothetical protein BUALT_Bualt02G0172700 [Buddleja alternifolia]|uniref:Cysteine proteinase inhibitor n=1 Tax=Buddleja alternifolia TaxID=168488 RepID=A0AAV6Y2H0_9LAMI|nr:hypothetical protein BUALT_Bualt02G0172700 [Buddleja alternifolia]
MTASMGEDLEVLMEVFTKTNVTISTRQVINGLRWHMDKSANMKISNWRNVIVGTWKNLGTLAASRRGSIECSVEIQTMYYLTVEAAGGGQKKVYEAKVWVKPWMNFKELQEFKHLADA